VRAYIDIQLVRVGLGISVDREHGTRMKGIMSAPATHPVIQLGYVAVLVNKNIAVQDTCL
jgi:hypothetical protein